METNDVLFGFEIKRKRKIDEIDAVLYEMEHIKCGAKLAFLERDDSNKSFAITFKTIPEDDTGVFHILEHSVLCGSDKFPVKEPFVELLKGSLKTFLNAMTYNDKTVYPVASRNDRDFYNLVDVYMDAVLNPAALKNENIFRQEGWHYELREDGELAYNGVVYNEMKGAYSSADSVADEEIMKLLYPGSCYSRDSGGNPLFIPELSYEEFKAAHGRFYNPSGALIFLDGTVRLDEILPLLDSYLGKYERTVSEAGGLSLPTYAPGSTSTVEYEISPDEDEEGKCRVYLGGKTFAFDDKEKNTAFAILRSAICGTNETPLKKALLDTGLCEDVTLRSLDGLYENSQVLEIMNVKKEDIEKLVSLTRDVLTKLYKNGLDRERLRALLNMYEFKNREKDFGSLPKGLVFGLDMLDSWLWGADPKEPLTLADTFASLRRKLDTGYFEELIYECFLKCEPVSLILLPSRTLGARREADERARLAKIKESMTAEELEKIRRDAEVLKAWQASEDSEEALATLPSLSISDINAEPEDFESREYSFDGARAFTHRLSTDGISYFELLFDASDLDGEEAALLPTLTSLYKNVRTKNSTVGELQNKILANLGTLSFNAISFATVAGEPRIFVQVSVSVLDENKEKAAELIEEILYSSDLSDGNELKNSISQNKLALEDAFISSGHIQALTRASSYTVAAAAAEEYLSGYEQYVRLKKFEKSFDTERASLLARLSALTEKIFTRVRLTVSQSASAPDCDFLERLVSLIKPGASISITPKIKPFGIKNEGILIPSQVSYAVAASNLTKLEKTNGTHSVARAIISYAHLWNSVRVQGGAYGAGLVVRRSAAVAFYSYRDPSPARSISCYRESGKFLRELVRSGAPLDKFIIGAFGDYDGIATPRSKGAAATLDTIKGWSREMEKLFRKELISTSPEDLLREADMLDAAMQNAGICVIGPASALDSCGDVLNARLEI